MEQVCHNCGRLVKLVALDAKICVCPECRARFVRPQKKPKAVKPVKPKPEKLEQEEPKLSFKSKEVVKDLVLDVVDDTKPSEQEVKG